MFKHLVASIAVAVVMTGGAITEAAAADWDDCAQADDANRAILACTNIIKSHRESRANLGLAYHNRGIAYSTNVAYDLAIADFGKAIEINPGDAIAYYYRGLAHYDKGDLNLANADFDRIIKIKPDFADSSIHNPFLEAARKRIAAFEEREPPSPPPATAMPAPSVIEGKGVSISLETSTIGGQSLTTISIDGDIEFGDEKRFIDAALNATGAVVVALNSLGGNLMAGIKMGEAIRLKGFRTLVMDGSMCASACALAWLGGRPRLMGPGAYVGFHAAYNDDPTQSVTAPGNAFVGSYLNKLGVSDQAIAYMTNALPGDMQWLTFDDADRIGLEVKEFSCPDCAATTTGANR